MNEITVMLDEEIKLNKKENWSKLDKTMKLKRLYDYADAYCSKNNLADELTLVTLKNFLKSKLNQRRFNTNKDLIYDTNKMIIDNIPNLIYDEGVFILTRNDGRHSTVKCLTPTKKN
jgi:hypothetical protein